MKKAEFEKVLNIGNTYVNDYNGSLSFTNVKFSKTRKSARVKYELRFDCLKNVKIVSTIFVNADCTKQTLIDTVSPLIDMLVFGEIYR